MPCVIVQGIITFTYRKYKAGIEYIFMTHSHTHSITIYLLISYWDGSMDSQSPETSPLWRYIGGNGQGSCIPNGPFAGIRAAYSTPHCVSRDFQKGSLPSEEVVAGTYLTQPTYAGFRPALETGYHTSVHVWVGGDFPVMYSSNGKKRGRG